MTAKAGKVTITETWDTRRGRRNATYLAPFRLKCTRLFCLNGLSLDLAHCKTMELV